MPGERLLGPDSPELLGGAAEGPLAGLVGVSIIIMRMRITIAIYDCDGGDGLVLVGGRREYLNEETYID